MSHSGSRTRLGPSILIVEDCFDMRDHLDQFLGKHGYRVTVACGGHEALRILRDTKFDIVLSDVQMLNGTGIALLKRMRGLGDTTPVVIMTGASDISEKEILLIGGNAFLKKPIDLKSMMDVLDAQIAPKERKRSK